MSFAILTVALFSLIPRRDVLGVSIYSRFTRIQRVSHRVAEESFINVTPCDPVLHKISIFVVKDFLATFCSNGGVRSVLYICIRFGCMGQTSARLNSSALDDKVYVLLPNHSIFIDPGSTHTSGGGAWLALKLERQRQVVGQTF